MNSKQESERRARLMKMRDERLPDIKKQFEEAQKRNFNSNFAEGGKDEALVRKVPSRGGQRSQNGNGGKKELQAGVKKSRNAIRAAETSSKAAVAKKSRNTAVTSKRTSRGAGNASQSNSKGSTTSKKVGLGVSDMDREDEGENDAE